MKTRLARNYQRKIAMKPKRKKSQVYVRFDGEKLMIRHHLKTVYSYIDDNFSDKYYHEFKGNMRFPEICPIDKIRPIEKVPTWQKIGVL